jgi:leucyl/phenylalanyl-tRNA--protein transferase
MRSYLDSFRIGKRTRRTLSNGAFTITFDHAFDDVIHGCRTVRKEGTGTWITEEMYDAYRELHRLGYTHSVEVWEDGELVGGLYGVGIGTFFAGESMFSRVRDASKFAFTALVGYTGYLASFGATEIPRDRFLTEIGPLQERAPSGPGWESVDGAEMLRRGLERNAGSRPVRPQ